MNVKWPACVVATSQGISTPAVDNENLINIRVRVSNFWLHAILFTVIESIIRMIYLSYVLVDSW